MFTFAGNTLRAPQIKSDEDLDLRSVAAIDLRSPTITTATTTSDNVEVRVDAIATVPNNVEVKVEEGKALCRICYEVCDEKNRMNMGCSCKGEVGFIHEECAVKWFKMKGNKKCDVCDEEVSNSTIRSLPSPLPTTTLFHSSYSWWKSLLILTGINTFCYFCFIMIMDRKWNHTTFIIVGPSSFVVGFLASFFAVFIGKESSSQYALVEFAFVAFFFAELYSTIHLKLLYVIMISSATGFGSIMLLSFIFIRCCGWQFQDSGVY